MLQRINNRASNYRIARAYHRCARCAELTPVVGLLLPRGHETRLIIGDDEAGEAWNVSKSDALLFLVEWVPEAVRRRIRRLAPHFRLNDEHGATGAYWMNHCVGCSVRQDDEELYCEPGGAFAPICASAAAEIQLDLIREPCVAQAGGYALAPAYFPYAQR
jgi:hypothetical protein